MHVRGFLLTTIAVRRTVVPETRAVSQDFTRLTRVNPLSDAGGTGLRPRVQGASPSLGRRAARVQQAGPGVQRCPFSESLFPAGNRRAPRKGDSDDRRGAARAPPRAPLGGRTERRGSQRPGLRANGGSWAGELDRGPRDPATRVGPGAEHPRRLRPSRQGWHGQARGWELHNLEATPAGPASSRGEPERGAAAGCPRDPCPRRSPRASPGLCHPLRAAHPGRARVARRPLRELRTEPGPRSPLTEAAGAPGCRSASLPPSRVSRALRPREATGAAHGRAGAGSSSACAAVAVASRVRGSAAMSARLTLSASLAARPPQPRSSLRRRLRGGRVPPLAAPRHSALQPSFLTLFCPSLPLSPGPSAHPAARWSRGAHPASAGLLACAPGGGPELSGLESRERTRLDPEKEGALCSPSWRPGFPTPSSQPPGQIPR